VQEIENLITELQTLRDTLQSEAARVQATPQIETDLLSYGKATVCRRISSMHSRAYPKRTLDL
jgi:hypothetical protein